MTPAGEAPLHVAAMQRGFAEALRRRANEVRAETYEFAGRPVRLRAVGALLGERTHRAFAHLRRSIGHGDDGVLTVDLWDETETGVACPPEAGAAAAEREWIACDGTLTASPDGRWVSFRYQDSVTTLDRHGQHIVGCRRSGSHLARGECSKPFVILLSIWYHDRGVQILHAGLIAAGGAGVLLPGESGTGKSTTCVAAVSQGLEYLGDDFVGLERSDDGAILGHSIFNTACIARTNLARFPEIRPSAVEDSFPEEDKPILFLSEIHPGRLRPTVPIRAVVLLRIRSARTEFRPARPFEALREFAASTLHTVVPRPGREALERIAAVVQQVPAYWLHLGPDLGDIRPSIERILAGAGSRTVA